MFDCQTKNGCSILIDMEYRTLTDGTRVRVHRVGRRCRGAFWARRHPASPVCVQWIDGRSFTIDEVLDTMPFGTPLRGRETARYRVRFGRHETDLYLERRLPRPEVAEPERLIWWVYATDVDKQGSAPKRRAQTAAGA